MVFHPYRPFHVATIENNTDQPLGTVILPDNSLIIAFHVRNPVSEVIVGQSFQVEKAVVCGLLTHAKEYIRPPGSKTILVKFQPWAAGLFFDGLHELTDRNNVLRQVVTNGIMDKTEDLLLSSPSQEMVIIDFLSTLFNKKEPDRVVSKSIQMIQQSQGQIRVEALADEIGSSRRNFERKFKEATGLAPKKFIENVRMERALRMLAKSDDLMEITYSCGYYDQSHFIHHFNDSIGVSPEKYVRNILPSVNWALADKALFL